MYLAEGSALIFKAMLGERTNRQKCLFTGTVYVAKHARLPARSGGSMNIAQNLSVRYSGYSNILVCAYCNILSMPSFYGHLLQTIETESAAI